MIRRFLAFAALLGLSAFSSPPLLADPAAPDASSTPNITMCNDDNAQRMIGEATDFYRRVHAAKAAWVRSKKKKPGETAGSAVAKRYDKTIDILWNRVPDCSSRDKRGDLSHEAFQRYMVAVLREAYTSAVMKMDEGNRHDAKFYITCYLTLQREGHEEAENEGWDSWIALEAESLPRIREMHKRICKLEGGNVYQCGG